MDTPSPGSMRARPLRAALLLAAAATVTVGVVAIVHDVAGPRIEANEREQRIARLAEVLGATKYDNDLVDDVVLVRNPELLGTDEPLPVHRARLAGQPVAALITAVAPDGYSASIRLLVAVGGGWPADWSTGAFAQGDSRPRGRHRPPQIELDRVVRGSRDRRSSARALEGAQGWWGLRPVHRGDRHATSRRRCGPQCAAVLRRAPCRIDGRAGRRAASSGDADR